MLEISPGHKAFQSSLSKIYLIKIPYSGLHNF